MAKRAPQRATRRATPKDIAVKKKFLLLAGKARAGDVLALGPDDIRVESVQPRAVASRLISGGGGVRRQNVVIGDMDPRDPVHIADHDPTDAIILLDFDTRDPIHP